jgi:hypothetical protein
MPQKGARKRAATNKAATRKAARKKGATKKAAVRKAATATQTGRAESPIVQLPTQVIVNPQLTIPGTLPFYYAGIQSIWLYFEAELQDLDDFLKPFKMDVAPVDFNGIGLVTINFFNAVALSGVGQPGNRGTAGFNETEVSIIACSKKQRDKVPRMEYDEFLKQGDQTKRIGAFRVWVLCDDPIAIAAGRQLFFENKVLTPYDYNVPSLNNPGVSAFEWTCFDETFIPGQHKANDTKKTIYSARVSLTGLEPIPSNMSEWIDLSWATKFGRLAGSRRNYFGMYDTYFIPANRRRDAVVLSVGKSDRVPTGADRRPDGVDRVPGQEIKTLIGDRNATAIQIFRSPPCIAEARPYWADL